MEDIEETRINARQIIMRSLTEEEYRATSDKVYRYTLKSHKRHREQKTSDSPYYNDYIYQHENGIEVCVGLGKHFLPSPKGKKRGVITPFSTHSRRRLKVALLSCDLTEGSWRCGVSMLLPWHEEHWDGIVLKDFRASVEAFRMSFTRCFPQCAMIYRVEVTRAGAEHIHAVFYAPIEDGWIEKSYTRILKSRVSADQKQFVGAIPPSADDSSKMEFLQRVISVLWFNSIKRRTISEQARLEYKERGVLVERIQSMPQMIQYMTSISSESKRLQSHLGAKAWGVIQKKHFKRNKPYRIDAHGRIRVLFLRCISRLCRRRLSEGRHSLAPFGWHYAKRRKPIGLILGINKELTNRILAWAENEMKSSPMEYIVPYRPKDSNPKNTSLFEQYLKNTEEECTNRTL